MRLKYLGVIMFCFSILVACSGDNTVDKPKEKKEENEEQVEEKEAIEVEKGLLNVELTIPQDLFEDDEVDAFKEELEQGHNARVKQNDNGAFTVKMSKKDHKKMLKEMKEELTETIDDIVTDEDFSSIKDITYNKSLSEFEMIVDEEAFENSLDGFATFALGISGMFYQAFAGKDVETEKVTIQLINIDTNEAFNEIVYPDAMDDMGDDL